MQFRKAIAIVLLVISLAVYLSGCSRDTRETPFSSGGENANSLLSESEEINLPLDGDISVKIIPENPSVSDDLHAITTGGRNVTYSWVINDHKIDGTNASVLKEGFLRGDTVTVKVSAENSEATDSVVIKNSLPIITAVTITPEYIHSGTDIKVDVRAEDPDRDTTRLTYKWFVNDTEIAYETGPILKSDYFERGDDVAFQVVPSDGKESGKSFNSALMTIPNAVPLFLSSPPLKFKSQTYTYQVRVEDPDGDKVNFRLSEAPAGMMIHPESGEIKWKIAEQGEGVHTVEIVAADDFGGEGFQRYALTVAVKED
jgi:hypothetical protein